VVRLGDGRSVCVCIMGDIESNDHLQHFCLCSEIIRLCGCLGLSPCGAESEI
jgi:hypothetical protein